MRSLMTASCDGVAAPRRDPSLRAKMSSQPPSPSLKTPRALLSTRFVHGQPSSRGVWKYVGQPHSVM